MERQKKNDLGITLIALVISIIVMLILAGVSLNATIGENGIVTQAQNAVVKQKLASYQEEFEMKKADEQIRAGLDEELFMFAINEDVKDIISTLDDTDIGKIAIYDAKLVYLGDSGNVDTRVASDLGYLVMSDDDYNYMLELNTIERAIKKIETDGSTKVGTAMGTASYGQVNIAGINYGLGWYIIGNDESTKDGELTALGLTEAEKTLMTHSPYIVKYSTGAVQSIDGKMMYAGTDDEIWRYTFNYVGEDGGMVITNLLSGVTADSPKTEDRFGDFIPSTTYATSGTTSGTIENYYKDDYTYNDEGGIVFTQTSNILNMPVDQTKPINKKFSVNFTIKCDINNQIATGPSANSETYGGHIVNISPLVNYYVLRTSIYKGWLRVFTFGSYEGEHKTQEYERKGLAIFNINEYNNKYLNIQITAEAKAKTRIYLNGSLVKEFNSGDMDTLKYDFCTIGDLRPGRGYKFTDGSLYNFALYGDILTDEQIAQNWNYIKNELGINETGDKVN